MTTDYTALREALKATQVMLGEQRKVLHESFVIRFGPPAGQYSEDVIDQMARIDAAHKAAGDASETIAALLKERDEAVAMVNWMIDHDATIVLPRGDDTFYCEFRGADRKLQEGPRRETPQEALRAAMKEKP